MDCFGIITAMKEEYDEVVKIMTNIELNKVYEIEYVKGKIGDKDVVVVQSGVGKVNAARTTQIIIDKLGVNFIINVGSAGALNSELDIGDIVIAEKVIQHDFDITAFNHNKGYITGVGDYISCDKNIIEKFEKYILNNDKNGKIIKGVIASGDIFCTEVNMKDKIRNKFNAQCVEMEGAAIAQVCYLDNIPFLVLRSISDSPNGNNAIVFDEYLKLASKKCAGILKEFFENI